MAVRPHIYLLVVQPILPHQMFSTEGSYAGNRFFVSKTKDRVIRRTPFMEQG